MMCVCRLYSLQDCHVLLLRKTRGTLQVLSASPCLLSVLWHCTAVVHLLIGLVNTQRHQWSACSLSAGSNVAPGKGKLLCTESDCFCAGWCECYHPSLQQHAHGNSASRLLNFVIAEACSSLCCLAYPALSALWIAEDARFATEVLAEPCHNVAHRHTPSKMTRSFIECLQAANIRPSQYGFNCLIVYHAASESIFR